MADGDTILWGYKRSDCWPKNGKSGLEMLWFMKHQFACQVEMAK